MFDARAAPSIEPHGSFVVNFGGSGFVGRMSALPHAALPQSFDTAETPEDPDAEDAAFADGYAAGHAAAQRELDEARARMDSVASALEVLHPVPQAALAGLLAECVTAMLGRCLAAVTIDNAALTDMAVTMIANLSDEVEAVALHAHPDDVALLADLSLAVPLHPDAGLAPGTLRLATRQGWLEDGLSVRLARFRDTLAGKGAA